MALAIVVVVVVVVVGRLPHAFSDITGRAVMLPHHIFHPAL